MSSLTDGTPVNSVAISKATISQRFFQLCYVIAIVVATFGWLSAFGWLTIKVAKWLLT
jgi:hypothetical protein